MAKAFPASSFVGYDIAEDAIERARAEAATEELGNARFGVRDTATLDTSTSRSTSSSPSTPFTISPAHSPCCDASTTRSPPAAFTSWWSRRPRATSRKTSTTHWRPGSTGVSTLHCLTVSLAQDGAGLGTSWGEQRARRALADAGFPGISSHDAPGDPLDRIFVCRKP
jgi:hypothetical protein